MEGETVCDSAINQDLGCVKPILGMFNHSTWNQNLPKGMSLLMEF